MRLGQACVRRSESRVLLDNLLEQITRRLRGLRAPVAQDFARLEIEKVGVDIEVVAQPARPERQAQLLDDAPRDLILDGEDVLELAIELLSPQRHLPRDLNQLDVDAQAGAGAKDGPLDDQIRSELLTDFAQVPWLAVECE